MNRSTRTYESPLRQDQRDATRVRILEGLIRVIASDGVGEISIPAVAKEADVSVPTVYHHFGSKQTLIEAMGEYVAEKAGLSWTEEPLPNGVDDFMEMISELYRRSEGVDPAWRAAMATSAGGDARRAQMPRRLEVIEHVLRPLVGSMSEEDFVYLRNVVLILGSSAVRSAFKDYLGFEVEQAAETATWAIRRLLESRKET